MRWRRNMHELFVSAVAIGLTVASAVGNTYYVSSVNSSDGNSGTEAQPWRHIAYAATQVAPGDTVYIQAGRYADETVTFPVDGTEALRILFAGYQTTPGDTPQPNFAYGDDLNDTLMPLLDGGDRTAGTAIDLSSRQYITVRNLQITNYEKGVHAWNARSLMLENIVVVDVGNVHACPNGECIDDYCEGGDRAGQSCKMYSGKGINLGYSVEDSTVSGCTVVNAGAEGITVFGDHNLIANCKVYCDDNVGSYGPTVYGATDYYIVVTGNNNEIAGCNAERVGDLSHQGHGIGLKGDEIGVFQNNRIVNSVAKNLGGGFYVRHRGVQYNQIENCTVHGLDGFIVRDGASDNTFRNCRSYQAENAVVFWDSVEDGGAQYAGRNNTFVNCLFRDTQSVVIGFTFWGVQSEVEDNEFVSCVINGGLYLFRTDRPNSGNSMRNSIITGRLLCVYGSCQYDLPVGTRASREQGFNGKCQLMESTNESHHNGSYSLPRLISSRRRVPDRLDIRGTMQNRLTFGAIFAHSSDTHALRMQEGNRTQSICSSRTRDIGPRILCPNARPKCWVR